MCSKILTGLLASAFIPLLGLNPAVAAEKSEGIAAYVKAEAQHGKIKGDVIEIVREQTGREDAGNGPSGSDKRRNTEQGTSSGKRKNPERDMPGSSQRQGIENEMPGSSERRPPETETPGSEESFEMEEMPEPDTGSGDTE
ncbi:hypothetical protein [Methylocaldum sp.]|uniref:hypothetical protein n=1 Tax=Methylocaldum sp. TaxID=1969727 RepID=UPI002D290F83|nr:hypothetical protein [Methylocaldum sp.]HYE34693.1 hypothetical protein [Methylocaldum sp.]